MIVSTAPELSQLEKQQIIDELTKRGAILPCPRCASGQFSLIDTVVNIGLGLSASGLEELARQSVPSAVCVCTHCGFVAHHALGVLGMLPSSNSGR